MARPGYTVPVDIAREYMSKPEFASMPRLKLARIMHAENPIVFSSPEDARGRLRYIAGKKGSEMKKHLGTATQFIEEEDRPKNPYNIPHSDEISFEPFFISGHKRLGLMNDIHTPYHSMSAVTAAIGYMKKDKVDGLLLNGDIMDMYSLSRFMKDPRKRKFGEELKIMADLLTVFQKELDCQIYFKYGNHEERYEHFLFEKAKELVGVEELSLEEMIKKRVPGVQVIKGKRIIKANGLNIIHGHEYQGGMFSPVNVARGLFLRGKTSALQGHSHQTSEHTESDMNGKITTTWSVGCLCELNPEWNPLNKWNHGMCIVDLEDGHFDVRNKRIVKGKVL